VVSGEVFGMGPTLGTTPETPSGPGKSLDPGLALVFSKRAFDTTAGAAEFNAGAIAAVSALTGSRGSVV
jgi:hypothetical protein